MGGVWKNKRLQLVIAATCLICWCFGQCFASGAEATTHAGTSTESGICGDSMPNSGAKAALRLVCLRDNSAGRNLAVQKAIIIGFVGGFVRSDDIRHPEVEFAAHLREIYPSAVHTEVFANHDGLHALQRVLALLHEDGTEGRSSRDKQPTTIIIYGHSWGGSQAVTLARELGQMGIPVSLIIQVDSVHKPGHEDAVIPPNVHNAVNFYQTRGLIHGRSRIRAADPERTRIVGNFLMSYQDRHINCDNYPWIARRLNRPHHEIENDPRVWEQIAAMIESELVQRIPPLEASSNSLIVTQDQP